MFELTFFEVAVQYFSHYVIRIPPIEANAVSSIWRFSGKLGISQSCMVHHLHDLSKNIQDCQIVSHITKIFEKFLTYSGNTEKFHNFYSIEILVEFSIRIIQGEF